METLLIAQKSLDLLHILKSEKFNLKPDETIAVLRTAATTIENVVTGEVMKATLYQILEKGGK